MAHRNPVVAATPDCYLGICGRCHDQCCPQVKTLKNRLKFFSPFLADFYDYNVASSPPAKHQQQGGFVRFVGPVTREEHDLQLWYSGGLPEEPRPRNLLGSKSYEEYRVVHLLRYIQWLGCVDCDLGCSPELLGQKAATEAAHKPEEILKCTSKSTQPTI